VRHDGSFVADYLNNTKFCSKEVRMSVIY